MAGNGGSGVKALLLHPLFVACAVLYAALLVTTRALYWMPPHWASSWLADALCMPVVLTLALAVQRWMRRKPTFVLPGLWVLLAWAAVSIWFEVVAPQLLPHRYTADWLDVLAYGVGSLVFSGCLNPRQSAPLVPKRRT
jgi:hypothetical protein